MILAARYQVLRVLGRGAFGSVVLAQDKQLGRSVAVKLLHDTEAAGELLARFQREATVTARLRNPHVVRVLDHGDHEGRPFVVYEYLEGESLRERLLRGPIPPAEALRWARQGCEGLAAAHSAGVLHRDLKPGNVMLRADTGDLVLCDFGLAADAQARTALTATEEGTPGTPLYLAIEQLDGQATPASDQFSWALVVYEMLTGEALRDDLGVFQRLAGLLATREHELPPEARASLGDLDPPLRRALEPDPADRYPDIEAFARDLEEEPPPTSEVAPEAPRPSPAPPLAAPGRSGPPGRAGLALLLLGLLGLAGISLWPRRAPPPSPPDRVVAAGASREDRPLPAEVGQAYRRLGGPLVGTGWTIRREALGPEAQAWILDDRFPLRWRAYLRALRPWLATGPEGERALALVHRLPATLGDQLIAAREQARRGLLEGSPGEAALESIDAWRGELAAAVPELLRGTGGAASLVFQATLFARDLLPPSRGPEAPDLPAQVLASTGDCQLLRWARHELAVAAPSDALACDTRAALLVQAEGCEGARDELVVAARIRAARACPGTSR